MTGPQRVSLVCETTASTDVIRRNVATTIARGFPYVPQGERIFSSARIIAGGMSALDAPLEPEFGVMTVAINGAMKLFRDKGLAPDYWVSCEPRDHIAGHLLDVPEHTIYLPASQCSPAVFDRLEGRQVYTWHAAPATTEDMVTPGDHMICGSLSTTLTTIPLLAYMGFATVETWGWDGCYRDGQHHSGTAPPDDPRTVEVNVEVGDRVFASRNTWALEAQEACRLLDHMPIAVDIRGGGMIAAIREYLYSEWQRRALAAAAAE